MNFSSRLRFALLPLGLPLLLALPAHSQNQALYMDGSASGVDVPGTASLDVQAAYTFEAWIQYQSGSPAIFRKDGFDQFPYQFVANATVINVGENWWHGNNAGSWCQYSNGSPLGASWVHVAASFNGTQLTIYLNGLPVQTCAMPPPNSNVAAPLHMGWVNSAYSGPDYLHGWLDEVRIWNVARTAQEITQTINTTINAANAPSYPGLVGCWSFDGNANDSTGVNHGATFGTASFAPAIGIPILDCNGDGILDALQFPGADCNSNGILDACDIASGTSTDCDGNGVPDSCDIASGGPDCNGNGVLDVCDIASGTSLDPNGNGIPEECESSITTYCSPAAPNAVSASGSSMTVQGVPSTILNNLVFTVNSLPPNKPGLFIYGPFQNNLPAGNGFVCIGGIVQRVPPALISNAQGTVTFPVDLTQFPFTGGLNTITPGSSWNFQFWHRDPTGGLFGFNFSDAVKLTFAP